MNSPAPSNFMRIKKTVVKKMTAAANIITATIKRFLARYFFLLEINFMY